MNFLSSLSFCVYFYFYFFLEKKWFSKKNSNVKKFLGSVFSMESICIIINVFIVLVFKKQIYFCEYIKKNNVIRMVKNKFSFVNILGRVW